MGPTVSDHVLSAAGDDVDVLDSGCCELEA
jgi:hypothetical protein